LNVSDDDLQIRNEFNSATGLRFKPTNYTLWRNYGRVFKLLLLGQSIGEKIEASSLAKAIHAAGGKQLDSDRYLEHIFALTRFPHPAFQEYQAVARPVRPFVAVFRLLLLNSALKRGVSAEDVCTRLIANCCVGDEIDSVYSSLPVGAAGSTELIRQVREMLKFASQHSAFAWLSSRLVPANRSSLEALLARVSLLQMKGMQAAAEDDFRTLAQLASGTKFASPWAPRNAVGGTPEVEPGITFLEGDRRLVQHSRLERNRRLRKYVIKQAAAAAGNKDLECNCCGLVPRSKYAWANSSLLEVHHLLPLSSPARPNSAGTNYSGVVLVCPTCHRAVHARYRIYLNERNVGDFSSEAEAAALYEQVRKEILAAGPNTHP
jgi:5-methylcytosine-specific restriction endonuclease McrA